jgi:hypothetical protein
MPIVERADLRLDDVRRHQAGLAWIANDGVPSAIRVEATAPPMKPAGAEDTPG